MANVSFLVPPSRCRVLLPGNLAVGAGSFRGARFHRREPSALGGGAHRAELEVTGQRDEPGAPSWPACEPDPGQKEPRPPSCSSQMEASLTCAVCLSLFEEPVTLPLCSHNFCRNCVLECLASTEAARLNQQRGQEQAGRGASVGPGAGGPTAGARVSCPLCRKLCPLPRGGAAALPINTTLAEVVKLYRSGTAGADNTGEVEQGQGPGLLSPLAVGGTCQKHPSRLVQLYCRLCCQAGCGQCISEEHHGIFHSVSPIDTLYQEEKLTFFSSLKKLRKINEKLMNELSSQPNDTDMVLKNDAEIIAQEFGEIFQTLEMKKRQLLEDAENQRIKKEKEFQIWKKMKETHKTTIENFLKDCEKLIHECDPQRFLEVACGLNTRMKNQIDLMNIASSYEKPADCTQERIDIKPVVNQILALKFMPINVVKDLPFGGNENSTKNTLFKNNTEQRQDQKNIPNTFLPVAEQEEALADDSSICTHLMSISEMSASQNMSYEELRYKYYTEHQKFTNEFMTQTLPTNTNYKCVTAEALKDGSSGILFVPSRIKANKTDKVKMRALQRADGFERSFSGTTNCSIPSTNMNFSSGGGLFCGRNSQEVTTVVFPENSNNLMQASAVTMFNKKGTNSSTSSGLNPAASVAVNVSNSEFLDVSAERPLASTFSFKACKNSLPRLTKNAGMFSAERLPAPAFSFSACNNSLPGLRKDAGMFSTDRKYVFPQFYLGGCDRADKSDKQDESKFGLHSPGTKTTVSDASTSSNVDSAESEKTNFSLASGNSERDCFSGLGVRNSFKFLPFSSFFNQSEKPSDKNTSSHMREKTASAKETAEYGTQKPSVSWEQKANASETNTAAVMNDVSKSHLLPSNSVFSFKQNCFQFAPPVFSFGSIVRNTSDLSISSVVLSGNGTEKEKMKSHNKIQASPDLKVCAESATSHPKCEGSFLPLNSSKETESAEMSAGSSSCRQPFCSIAFPVKYENVSSTTITVTKPTKVKDEESETVAENNSYPRREDEPESVQFQNAACSVSDTCNDPSSGGGGSVLTANEAVLPPSDSDSDTEGLSQASVSTDTSSASEYFSVAEDTVSSTRKSET